MTPADFTHLAAELVARNDRRAWRRALLSRLRHAAERVGLAWSVLVVVGVLLWILPMSSRAA